MKKLYVTIVVLTSVLYSFGQSLGQDSEGFSSILLPSTTINIDGKNNVVNVAFYKLINTSKVKPLKGKSLGDCFNPEAEYYNENRPFIADNISTCVEQIWSYTEDEYNGVGEDNRVGQWLLGAELTGASKNGLALIFGEGVLANQANANFVIGWQKRTARYDRNDLKVYTNSLVKKSEIENDLYDNEAEINENVQLLLSAEAITEGIAVVLNISHANRLAKGVIADVEVQLEKFNTPNQLYKKWERVSELISYIGKIDDILFELKNTLRILDSIFPLDENGDKDDWEIAYKCRSRINFIVDEIKQLSNNSEHEQIEIQVNLENLFDKDTWKNAHEGLHKKRIEISTKKNRIEKISDSIDIIFDSLKTQYGDYITNLKKLKKIDDKIDEIYKDNVDFNKHVVYGKAGFIGNSFLYNLDNGSNLVDERIVKRNFQGTRFELGWTHQFLTNNVMGVNVSRSHTDNSSRLTSTEYTFKVIDDTVSPNLESSTEIEAMSGPYDRFDKYQIAADYVRYIPLKEVNNLDDQKKSADVYLLINPYFRHNFYANSETLKPNTSFGFGLYAFNIKENAIAGGVFAQADDVFNVNRSTALPFTRQIQIGLVFKLALDSFNPKKS